MKTKTFTITICGDRWTYRVLSDEAFKQTHAADIGTDKGAVTMPWKRRMEFSVGALTLPKMIHELTHAYCEYIETGSETFTRDQLEEMFCCLNERRYEEMGQKARRMLKNMQGVLNDEGRVSGIPQTVLRSDDGDHQA